MESVTIVSWSIFILATISLMLYFKAKNRKKEKNIFSELQYFAQENNCLITSYDHWGKSLIGISAGEASKLFYIRKIHNIEYREHINLSDICACQLKKEQSTIKLNKKKLM